MTLEQNIRGYMLAEAAFCDNATELAENAAHHFDRDDWLDDETHVVWDLAIEFIPGE